AELGDAFVALPGGAGTLEELFEAWTWQQLGLHAKTVALYYVDQFWVPLINMLDHMNQSGFIGQNFQDALIVAKEPEELLSKISIWTRPTAKWTKSVRSRRAAPCYIRSQTYTSQIT